MSDAQARPERLKGRVKWFNSAKGFGFITLEGSDEEVFVHQSNIDTTGFRSLHEGEDVEFDLVIGDDEKKKAFHVTGPDGAPVMGGMDPARAGYSPGPSPSGGGGIPSGGGGGGNRSGIPSSVAIAAPLRSPYGDPGYPPGASPYSPGGYPPPQQQQQQPGSGGRGVPPPPSPGAYYPPLPSPEAAAYMAGYYPMPPPAGPGGGYAPPGPYPMFPRGRGQFFPGGRNWAGARPPPPGQPGFSSGLQVVVHNLPWDCTWQQLKDAFGDCGDIERADVVFDSRGRSRGFGIVRFPTREAAEEAVAKMNNATIGGRVVSVRLDRFA